MIILFNLVLSISYSLYKWQSVTTLEYPYSSQCNFHWGEYGNVFFILTPATRVIMNQYNKVIKTRSECRLYKLTGGQADGQAGRQAGSARYLEAAPLKIVIQAHMFLFAGF